MKRIESLLKNNSFFNKMYSLLGSWAVKLIGIFVKMQPKTILFVSFSGKSFNDSPKDIYKAMLKDPFFKDYTFIWAFKNPDDYDVCEGTLKVKIDTLEYLKLALAAQYWVTNVNIERGLHFKKSYTKYINTWHGIPMKYVGNHVKGRSDFNFYTVDVFTYSSEYEYNIYKEAFKLTDRNLFKFGMPRNDVLINNEEAARQEVLDSLGIKDKKVILYAPTWREDPSDLVVMDLKPWAKALKDTHVFLIKMHGLSDSIHLEADGFVMDVTDFEETSHLLLAVDILITDYSSIMFDFGLLQRPILLYMSDYEKYKKERGLYFDIEETQLPIAHTGEALLDLVLNLDYKKEAEVVKAFTQRFIEVNESNATELIINKGFKGD